MSGMRRRLLFGFYNLLLPVAFVLLFPGWLWKMVRRGGWGSGLRERFTWYAVPAAEEPRGAVYVHAVSVGEVMIALKLIAGWQGVEPAQRFILAATTATGHAVAVREAPAGVRVIYAPWDFPMLVRRCLRRFAPSKLVLVESELWPNLLAVARRRTIPIALVNARLSPRSERRYSRFRPWVAEILGMLDCVGVQEPDDIQRWAALGVPRQRLHLTGSIKFDPAGARLPEQRAEFAAMLDAFGRGRPVVLAASTHAGEEAWIARAVEQVAGAPLLVVVPRHAERRHEVKAQLEALGLEVVLRSRFTAPATPQRACLVVDSTGELRDWTAHASVVVIGKSLLSHGGQSPVDAVLANVPVICGPNMENFAALAGLLERAGGLARVASADELVVVLGGLLGGGGGECARRAHAALDGHAGATLRSVAMLGGVVEGAVK